MTRPLRSPPPRAAGASPLLQAGPPAHPASVFSPLRVLPAWDAPSHRPQAVVSGCAFPRSVQKQQTRLTSPSCRTPSGQSAGTRQTPPGPLESVPVLMPPVYVTARHQRSPHRGLHTVFLVPTWRISCAFSTSLTTTVFSQRSRWRFEASPRRAAPKGQPSSLAQHRFQEPRLHQQLLSAFVAHRLSHLAGRWLATRDECSRPTRRDPTVPEIPPLSRRLSNLVHLDQGGSLRWQHPASTHPS